MTEIDNSIRLSDIRNFAQERGITLKKAKEILCHYAYIEEYSTYPRYPKEVEKLIYEDKNGNTCIRLLSVKY